MQVNWIGAYLLAGMPWTLLFAAWLVALVVVFLFVFWGGRDLENKTLGLAPSFLMFGATAQQMQSAAYQFSRLEYSFVLEGDRPTLWEPLVLDVGYLRRCFWHPELDAHEALRPYLLSVAMHRPKRPPPALEALLRAQNAPPGVIGLQYRLVDRRNGNVLFESLVDHL